MRLCAIVGVLAMQVLCASACVCGVLGKNVCAAPVASGAPIKVNDRPLQKPMGYCASPDACTTPAHREYEYRTGNPRQHACVCVAETAWVDVKWCGFVGW